MIKKLNIVDSKATIVYCKVIGTPILPSIVITEETASD